MRKWTLFASLRDLAQSLAVLIVVGSAILAALAAEAVLAAVLTGAIRWDRSRC